jgi:hypothetical protein
MILREHNMKKAQNIISRRVVSSSSSFCFKRMLWIVEVLLFYSTIAKEQKGNNSFAPLMQANKKRSK